MAKIIDDETMEHVCILAKLSLSEEEKEKAKAEMQTFSIVSSSMIFAMIFSLYILPVTFYIAFISDFLFTVPDGSYLAGRDRFHGHSLHR